jgi:hypothetical protein
MLTHISGCNHLAFLLVFLCACSTGEVASLTAGDRHEAPGSSTTSDPPAQARSVAILNASLFETALSSSLKQYFTVRGLFGVFTFCMQISFLPVSTTNVTDSCLFPRSGLVAFIVRASDSVLIEDDSLAPEVKQGYDSHH